MNPKNTVQVLNEFLYQGYADGVFAHVKTHVINFQDRSKVILGPDKDIGMIDSGGICFKEYIRLISDGCYSAILADYSIISIECIFLNDKICRHRYIYIPCPIKSNLTFDRPEEISISDYLQQIDLKDMRDSIISQGFLRFDYTTDPSPQTTHHPLSHLTFISSTCRVGLRSPISIAGFLNFIFDNFYSDQSKTWLTFQPHLNSDCEDTIRDHETLRMHLYWVDPV